jgi:hypothetical protein
MLLLIRAHAPVRAATGAAIEGMCRVTQHGPYMIHMLW